MQSVFAPTNASNKAKVKKKKQLHGAVKAGAVGVAATECVRAGQSYDLAEIHNSLPTKLHLYISTILCQSQQSHIHLPSQYTLNGIPPAIRGNEILEASISYNDPAFGITNGPQPKSTWIHPIVETLDPQFPRPIFDVTDFTCNHWQ